MLSGNWGRGQCHRNNGRRNAPVRSRYLTVFVGNLMGRAATAEQAILQRPFAPCLALLSRPEQQSRGVAWPWPPVVHGHAGRPGLDPLLTTGMPCRSKGDPVGCMRPFPGRRRTCKEWSCAHEPARGDVPLRTCPFVPMTILSVRMPFPLFVTGLRPRRPMPQVGPARIMPPSHGQQTVLLQPDHLFVRAGGPDVGPMGMACGLRSWTRRPTGGRGRMDAERLLAPHAGRVHPTDSESEPRPPVGSSRQAPKPSFESGRVPGRAGPDPVPSAVSNSPTIWRHTAGRSRGKHTESASWMGRHVSVIVAPEDSADTQ